MLVAPLFSLFFLVMGTGFLMSFTSLYLKDHQVNDFQIGLIQSSFFFGMLVSSLLSEKLIARVGHIRTLTATCGLLSAVTLGLFLVSHGSWFTLRFLAGACVGSFYVAVESWLLAEYPSNKKGTALAYYTITLYAALTLSQLFIPFTENKPAAAFIISALFVSLAVIPVSIGKSNGPAITVVEPTSLIKFFKLSPLGVAGSLISGMILSSLYSFMPVYFETKVSNTGYLMTVMVLGGTLLQYPIGKLSDRFERRRVLTFLGITGGISCILLALSTSPSLVYAEVFLMGGLLFTIYPVAMTLGCDCVEGVDLVKMTGVLIFAYGLGAVIGPILTPLGNNFSDHYSPIMVGLYSVLLAGTGFYALATKKRIPQEEQTDFSLIPTTPLVEELYPQPTIEVPQSSEIPPSSIFQSSERQDHGDESL